MKKTHDYIHHYRGYWSDGGKCRIRIYRADGQAPVVICSQLPGNDNTSVRKDAGEAVGGSGDEGIDGIIKEDRLGLEVVYIQAKRWENTVQRPESQKFVGALSGQNSRKGVFITTSSFSAGAIDYATGLHVKVVLIDGETLANHMIDCGVGVAPETAYEIKHVDSDYFDEA